MPKDQLPEHIHEDGQIILAVDPGYLSRAFDRDAHGAGFDLVYNPPGTVHRDCFLEVGGRFLSVAIPRHLSPSICDPLHMRGMAASTAAARIVGMCIDGGLDATVAENVTLDLLGEVVALPMPPPRPAWLKQAEEMISASATHSSSTIAGIAKALGLHPVYFARAYKAALGHGPAKALQRFRLATAVSMLSCDRSLAEVAASCGFADQSHLSRSLRAAFAATPSALRDAFDRPRLRMFKTGALADV